jgi:putative hydrolase of the HAD superfamily
VRYRAVIFDLFQTLISLQAVGVTRFELNEPLGVPAEIWNPAWVRYEDDRARGRYRSVLEFMPLLAHDLGLPAEPERWAVLCAERKALFRKPFLEAEPETLGALAELKALDLRLGLLSDADGDEVAAWPASPLSPYFDLALFSCYEGLRKPEREFYLRLCHGLGVEPAQCLYVGDGRSDEHLGARAVGMTPLLMTRFLARFAPERIPLMAPRCAAVVESVNGVVELIRAAQ